MNSPAISEENEDSASDSNSGLELMTSPENESTCKPIELKEFEQFIDAIEPANLESDNESSDSSCEEHFIRNKKRKQFSKMRV